MFNKFFESGFIQLTLQIKQPPGIITGVKSMAISPISNNNYKCLFSLDFFLLLIYFYEIQDLWLQYLNLEYVNEPSMAQITAINTAIHITERTNVQHIKHHLKDSSLSGKCFSSYMTEQLKLSRTHSNLEQSLEICFNIQQALKPHIHLHRWD